MKTVLVGLVLGTATAAFTTVTTGCSRNNIEAVNLSNEGDKARQSNIDEAISKYEQATNLDPTNHRIMWKLATAYQKKEAWDKVASTCSRAEKLAPKHANYFFLHGYALAKQAAKGPSGWADAKGPLATAIQLDPNYADAHFELANVLLHLDDEAGALQNYSEAIQKKPDEGAYYGPLADLYIRLNFFEQADQVLKEGVAFVKPDDVTAQFVLRSLAGEVKEVRGDFNGAIAEFDAAKKACGACNEKGQQIAYFNLGFAYSKAQPPRKNEAVAQLTKFQTTVCKGSAANRYADECAQAQEILKQLNGS
ncbi:tetratricopeptide repeat protein [Pendulispora albinea]|uniref:Tetratricopeptide repeat protein n=1 Tax=Pendulispora albinea TaxID=2741071 RepID=A0ABZ2M3N5_9BACT